MVFCSIGPRCGGSRVGMYIYYCRSNDTPGVNCDEMRARIVYIHFEKCGSIQIAGGGIRSAIAHFRKVDNVAQSDPNRRHTEKEIAEHENNGCRGSSTCVSCSSCSDQILCVQELHRVMASLIRIYFFVEVYLGHIVHTAGRPYLPWEHWHPAQVP